MQHPSANGTRNTPARESAARARHWNRQIALAVGGAVGAAEFATLVLAPWPGVVMLCGAVVLAALHEQAHRLAGESLVRSVEALAEERALAAVHDRATGLPGRQLFTDQLGREIARAQRYDEPVTLAIVTIARGEELRAAWGPEIIEKAVGHTAATLKRVARTSDFVARIDEERFGVALARCTLADARAFTERAALAVANRPLRAGANPELPVYVNVEVSALQFDGARFRGPLEFLSAAGGEALPPRAPAREAPAPARPSAPADIRGLRQQLAASGYGGSRGWQSAARRLAHPGHRGS